MEGDSIFHNWNIKQEMEELYNKLKEAKETPVLSYTLSPAELYILVEYIEKTYSIINELNDYINKMGFGSIVDNPKKDLTKILKKDKNYED